MEIAEELCDRIGILVNGHLTTSGTVTQLRQQAASGTENLEDIFLELTGAYELQGIIKALRQGRAETGGTDRGGGVSCCRSASFAPGFSGTSIASSPAKR
jgi:ABC-2 type transport system ATP-binding protein